MCREDVGTDSDSDWVHFQHDGGSDVKNYFHDFGHTYATPSIFCSPIHVFWLFLWGLGSQALGGSRHAGVGSQQRVTMRTVRAVPCIRFAVCSKI